MPSHRPVQRNSTRCKITFKFSPFLPTVKRRPGVSIGSHRLRPNTTIAIPFKFHRLPRTLLAGGLCWLAIALPGLATIDLPSSLGSPVGDPLRAEVARIEQYGSQYALTTYCGGMRSIYVQPTTKIDLGAYIGQYVRAVILEIDKVEMSEAELEEFRRTCSPPRSMELKHDLRRVK